MASVEFEYDPERLIEEVKKRPGIWNFEDIAYRTKSMRQKLWNEVVRELMQSDVKVTKSEMRELELQLQKKWKSIRDCFQKYVMNPNRSKRPYIYSKKLQFLLKTQDPMQQDPSSESDCGEADKRIRIWRSKRKLKLIKESSEDDNDHYINSIDDSKSNCSNDGLDDAQAKESNKSNTVMVDEFAFANVDAPIKNENEDPDKLFLLSLLPHLKSIPEGLRLNAKMEMMQVLRNANLDHKVFLHN